MSQDLYKIPLVDSRKISYTCLKVLRHCGNKLVLFDIHYHRIKGGGLSLKDGLQ